MARRPIKSLTLGVLTAAFVGMSSTQGAAEVAPNLRALDNATGGTRRTVFQPKESLGPCSRRTGLVISEIMYQWGMSQDSTNRDFVEIYNSNPFWEDISGYRLSGSIDYTFPSNTVIQSGAFIVVARNPAALTNAYGIANVVGPFTNAMPQAGIIQLRNPSDAILLEVNYSDSAPWPVGANGTGHSIVLARPSYGEGDPQAWDLSDSVGGSPGRADPLTPSLLQNVVINEFLAHSDDQFVDYIELYNHSTQAVDISGCTLSDDPATNKFVIPTNTIIGPAGFAVFYETNYGFGISSAGDAIYFKNPDGTRVLDAVKFDAQALGRSTGRYPDGAAEFYPLQALTPGTNNSDLFVHDIVINEIMYKPISGLHDDQYVELYNRGTNAVNLGGWSLVDGVSYTFPSNTILAADSYLVIAKNAARLLTNYPNLTTTNTFGNFGGTLAGAGERIALAMPDVHIATNKHGVLETNTVYVTVDEVTYKKGGRWGHWADEGGSSLELIDPRANHRLAANWADSDETHKAPWTNVEYTGVLDLGVGTFSADNVHILMLDEGECLVDNVEVIPVASGNNLVSNSTFESGTAGWYFQGNHERSGWETNEGYLSSRCLHVRASGRGDTGADKIRAPLSSAVTIGSKATLRAKVRWLRGFPEILLRLHGNWLEAVGRMAVPANLGTPGARNTRAVSNAPPAIYEVVHAPILPSANQPVVVTARVHDPDGISSLVLKYRVDPAVNYTNQTMRDDGTGDDRVAGDGVYSATIPGQPAGTLVAFAIEATDNRAPSATSLFPNDAPVRECLIRFGESQPAGDLPTYRVWITQATFNRWSTREKLSSFPLDATFVYGDRRVCYNIGAYYKGSPFLITSYTTPTGNQCGYDLEFPPDDSFLGTTGFALDFIPRDGSCIREQIVCWVIGQLGVAFNRRNSINLFVNGVGQAQRPGGGPVYEDCHKPNADFVNCWVPNDTQGDLMKLDDGFEFNDAATSFDRDNGDPAATLENFTTTGGVKKVARYRWHWRARAYHGTANNYSNVFALVDAATATASPTYAAQIQSLVDIEQWMRVFLGERIAGNWDSYGYRRGKNMYAYKPEQGGWQLFTWDIDFFDGSTFPPSEVADPVLTRFYNNPTLLRAYYRAVQDAVNGPLLPEKVNPVIDARYAGLVANNIPAANDTATIKSWLAGRRSTLLGLLNSVAASFGVSGSNYLTTGNNLITLTGAAPVEVKSIFLNGHAYPLTWTSPTAWQMQVILGPGTNELVFQGYDRFGNPLATAVKTNTVVYTGVPDLPQNSVVINEIMYNPTVTNASYVELYNASATTSFDLSYWRFNGLAYTFPFGTIMPPRGFFVLAQDPAAFNKTYGTNTSLVVFPTVLSTNSETLTLVKPGATPSQDLIVDQVKYESSAPWPAGANGGGAALQLIDPTQDNSRVCNWADASGWRFASFTGVPSDTKLYLYLSSVGDVYLDDLMLVAGTVPAVGTNYLVNGDFESLLPLTNTWSFSSSFVTNTVVSTTFSHSGNAGLHFVATTVGGPSAALTQITPSIVTNGSSYTFSFWYLPSTTASNLSVRLGSAFNRGTVVRPTGYFTPGTTNAVIGSLVPIPPLWLNEVQPLNLTTLTNSYGQYAPWLELYNAGTNVVPLDGLYLANTYTNLTQWAFPAGSVIHPGEFKVIFADGQPGLSTSNELHTSFQLNATNGSLALARFTTRREVLDYLNYSDVPADYSYGSFPDGQPFTRQLFFYPSPGATNNGKTAPLQVFVNEWMAGNTHTLTNPVTGKKDDWFELYNASTNTVNLGSNYLTDTLTNIFLFQIPTNYSIPPLGHLLVWADKQSTSNQPDLHVNFKLTKSGTAIGLFAPDGTPIDYVSFGLQTSDVSEGRCPDGGRYITPLPTPTPRASNICPVNTAPALSLPITNQTLYVGQTLSFTATASDAESPPETLAFSLGANAPSGAVINALSGHFTWTPNAAQAPSANVLTVTVTDDGVPPLSDARSFTVTVLAPLQIATIAQDGTHVTLGWATVPGKVYRVEYCDDLTTGTWLTLGNDISATGTSATIILDVTGIGQRFYRILVLN